MAGISCLLIGGVRLGERIKGLFQREPDHGGVVIVQEPGGNQDKAKQEKVLGEEDERGFGGDKAWGEDGVSLARGLEGIKAGIVGLARRSLALGQRGEADRDQSMTPWEPDEAGPLTVYLASDLHYMSEIATDYGNAFETFEAKSDGKVIRYLPQILDALIEETVSRKPDALILTGDITMNGELVNHLALAEKLTEVQESGVQVLIIPGNHDINNPNAAIYFGEKAEAAKNVTPEEFEAVYGRFGLDQAINRDDASLSYVYGLRDDVWLVLLDTAQYDPRNLVEGMVRPETLKWLEENLKAAKERDVQVIVLGHHNLLSESRMFTTMCTLENSQEVVTLLETYETPLYISGHLHLQRVNQHKKGPGDTGYGIYEIVSDALSIPPCQYGVLSWQENGDLDYKTRETDVEAWAVSHGVTDENLLNFSQYKARYIRELIGEQIKGEAKQVREQTAEDMARIYADVYADYCAGVEIDQRERMRSWEYQQWENCWPQSDQAQELGAMAGDCSRDYNAAVIPGLKARGGEMPREGLKDSADCGDGP